jgi:hypothetical protein
VVDVVVWWVWGCGSVGGVQTFQGLHSVRLWTPTIFILVFYGKKNTILVVFKE